jgi:deazaflavin-dependent oxidoreductase (nitroreductase family)
MAASSNWVMPDSALLRQSVRVVSRAHVWVYRRTAGRVGGRLRVGPALFKPAPVLLLDHVGRKSGRRFTTPLVYLADADRLVVVASQGGLPNHPQWFFNLQATPDTTVQVGPELREVRARTATPDERAALWPRLLDVYADFARYQSWTRREIPLVILDPARP